MNLLGKILAFLLLLSAQSLHSQTFTVHDTFDDNRYNWWTGESGSGSQYIKGGKLLIDIPENGWIISITPYVEFEKDFKAEMTFRQTAGLEDNGIGLLWGYSKKEKDENSFTITANGNYMISCSDAEAGKKIKGVEEWIKTDLVKPLGQTNHLRVEQVAKTLSFYINDKKVATIPAFHWQGRGVGIASYTKMKVEVDEFDFVQSNLKINLPETLTKGLVKENLGPAINTAADDLMPLITADGRKLYFGREYYEGNAGGKEDGEDFYLSNLEGDKWSLAKNLGSPINTTDVNNIISISTDNNLILFADGTKFFTRSRSEKGWGESQDIGLSFVNEATHFEGNLSADGKIIIFTLKNSDNLFYDKDEDERDLYVSIQDRFNKWSKPLNLGPTLNTALNEISPFLGADGRTLYFSSNGRPGYGDADIFMSKRIGDSWTNWSQPVNLGPEINTQYFDAYYVLPASGDFAYLVSAQNGLGKSDIVRIKLAKELKPEPVVLVKGKTLDAKTKQPISASILIDNLTTSQEVGEAISDPKTGDFQMILPSGSNNGFHAAAAGYLSVSENMELVQVDKYTEIQKDLYLLPITIGQTIQLNNVFFEQSKSVLKSESYPELDRLIAIMTENTTLEIELGGYTDNVGKPSSLIALSQDRVNIVKKYMTDKGVPSKRITGKGYGPANPLVKNDTEPHRRMNRRVEFKVTGK